MAGIFLPVPILTGEITHSPKESVPIQKNRAVAAKGSHDIMLISPACRKCALEIIFTQIGGYKPGPGGSPLWQLPLWGREGVTLLTGNGE
jgi:hypothetical protein